MTSNATSSSPRGSAIATILATITAAAYIAADAVSSRLDSVVSSNPALDAVLGSEAKPFGFLRLFGEQATSDSRLAWASGLGVAVVVTWLGVRLSARSAGTAVMGTWLSATVAAGAGAAVAAWVLALREGMAADAMTDLVYGTALPHGVVWGFLAGGALGVLAAGLALIVRRRPQPSGVPKPAAGTATSAVSPPAPRADRQSLHDEIEQALGDAPGSPGAAGGVRADSQTTTKH